MSRRPPKRKTSTGRFARLPLSLLGTPAITTLSHAAFRVVTLLAAQYTGYNNGALGLTRTQAAANGVSKNTLYDALRELETRGLIEQTYPSSRVPPRPTMYAISWVSMDDTDYSIATRLASHAYREWKPTPTAKRKRRSRPKLRVVTRGEK